MILRIIFNSFLLIEYLCYASTDLNCTIYPSNPNTTCCAVPALFDTNDLEKCSNQKSNLTQTMNVNVTNQSGLMSNLTRSRSKVNSKTLELIPFKNNSKLTVLAEECFHFNRHYKCLAKQFRFISKDEKFLSEPLVKFIIKKLRKSNLQHWIHSISNAAEICIKDDSNVTVEQNDFEIVETYNAAPFNISVDFCHPKHIALFHCIQIKSFISCPLIEFNKHEYCFDWKDYAMYCNNCNMKLTLLCKILCLSQIVLVISSICDQHPGIHPSQCCQMPSLYDENMMSNCRVQFKNLSELKSGNVKCFILCALSTTNNSVNVPPTVEGFASFITQNYTKTDPELAKTIQNSLFKCMNLTKNGETTGLSTKIGYEPGKFICDPNALLIKGCIAIEMFLNCPTNRLSNQTQCGTLRRYLNECRPH
uniref:CSON002050 protein n=1 Tax=Culicoides sonorensis TaxID=179676 RepID=A0A336MVW3_CULSO